MSTQCTLQAHSSISNSTQFTQFIADMYILLSAADAWFLVAAVTIRGHFCRYVPRSIILFQHSESVFAFFPSLNPATIAQFFLVVLLATLELAATSVVLRVFRMLANVEERAELPAPKFAPVVFTNLLACYALILVLAVAMMIGSGSRALRRFHQSFIVDLVLGNKLTEILFRGPVACHGHNRDHHHSQDKNTAKHIEDEKSLN